MQDSAPGVLVVDNDLFFSVRIETTLKRLGYRVRVMGSHEAALLYAAEESPALAIVNFAGGSLQPGDLVRRLKALPQPPAVLCFMPHKQMPELRPPARAAGADLVVANSALSLRLPQLAAKLVPLDGSAARVEEAIQIADEPEEA